MAVPKLIEEEPINLPILKDYLKKIKKRDEELNYRAAKTEEYVSQFNLLKVKEAKELYDAIDALQISRLRDVHIHKIVDVCPRSVNGLRVLFAGTPLSLSADNVKKILSAIDAAHPSKKKGEKEEEEEETEE